MSLVLEEYCLKAISSKIFESCSRKIHYPYDNSLQIDHGDLLFTDYNHRQNCAWHILPVIWYFLCSSIIVSQFHHINISTVE